MPLGPNQPVTANTYNVTYQAMGHFQDTAQTMQRISQAIENSRQNLVTSGYVSDAGGMFGICVGQWLEPFQKIIQDTQAMAEMLGNTVTLIKANEGKNAETVSALAQKANSTITMP
jgi:hypothetical protein